MWRNEERGAIVQILFNGLCNGALIALLAMAFVVVYLPTKEQELVKLS